MKVNWN